MPNWITHTITGAITGGLVAIIPHQVEGTDKDLNKYNITANAILGGAFGIIGGILPDILEPPTNPFHRRKYHSVLFGILLMTTSLTISKINRLPIMARIFYRAGVSGYIIHLVFDSKTPMRIPRY